MTTRTIARAVISPILLLWYIIVATVETVIMGKQPEPMEEI